jgi:hypothetical protein
VQRKTGWQHCFCMYGHSHGQNRRLLSPGRSIPSGRAAKWAALRLCASGYLPPTQAALMGRGSSGWAALTQTRHLIWLHRRTIPCPRVLSRQNQCRRDMGVESLGKGCDDIHLVAKQGADGHRRGGKQRRTSRRLIWCATTQAPREQRRRVRWGLVRLPGGKSRRAVASGRPEARCRASRGSH